MSDEQLPPGWEIKYSRSRNNQKYYFNRQTSQSVWEHPSTLEPTHPVNDKVRVAHILVKHAQSRRPASWKQVTVIS